MNLDIEAKVLARAYHSPARARAALTKSALKGKTRERVRQLISEWENEVPLDVVIGGAPAEAEVVEHDFPKGDADLPIDDIDPFTVQGALTVLERFPVNLNVRIRAHLTTRGVAILYAARDNVMVPKDLLLNQGVWETQLWEFMSVMGRHLHMGDTEETVTEQNRIELYAKK